MYTPGCCLSLFRHSELLLKIRDMVSHMTQTYMERPINKYYRICLLPHIISRCSFHYGLFHCSVHSLLLNNLFLYPFPHCIFSGSFVKKISWLSIAVATVFATDNSRQWQTLQVQKHLTAWKIYFSRPYFSFQAFVVLVSMSTPVDWCKPLLLNPMSRLLNPSLFSPCSCLFYSLTVEWREPISHQSVKARFALMRPAVLSLRGGFWSIHQLLQSKPQMFTDTSI